MSLGSSYALISAMATISRGGIPRAQEYYASVEDINVQHSFYCLDEPSSLEQLVQSVRSNATKNFVLDFSDETAWTGIDIDSGGVAALMKAERPECLRTRWLNIWFPTKQKKLLEVLAQHYDFSPRLLALMCSDPKQSHHDEPRTNINRSVHTIPHLRRKAASLEVNSSGSSDVDELSVHSSSSSGGSMTEGNHFKIAADIWHYASIDMGRRYVCAGFNSLYGTHGATFNDNTSDGGVEAHLETSRLPHCTRVWTWLIITTDHTVISITEDPFPDTAGAYTALQQRILIETRRNPIYIFRSLSAVQEPLLDPLTLLPIRTRLGSSPDAHRRSDAPGLLYYYLFENFKNSYTMVTRKGNRYGVELANLRKSMVEQPTLKHVDRLDRIGNELGVLRRHYDAYLRIIDRLLEPQEHTLASLQNSQVAGFDDSGSTATVRPPMNDESLLREDESTSGVSLSWAALVRFRRLRDLIDLYALKEVEEYMKQKESLLAMNLSLVAYQQSLHVERLTRAALLLTKATILFLPVSFMTGYFSVPLGHVEYSLTTYWVAFTACFSCTCVLLWHPTFLYAVAEGIWSLVRRSVWSRIMRLAKAQRD